MTVSVADRFVGVTIYECYAPTTGSRWYGSDIIMRQLSVARCCFALAFWVNGPVQAQDWRSPEQIALLAVDAQQRTAVASADLQAIARISHTNLRVNAPSNRILTRDDLVRMVGSGEIRNEQFERVPEEVVITGDVGVVMGSETVTSGANTEQARLYGTSRLSRRYTNVYLRQKGTWRHIARHANVISTRP